jgi:hypothetical protein
LIAIGAWIAIDHYRTSTLIPVPGAGPSTATATAAPSPTIAPSATPTAPPPTVAPRREHGNLPERPPHTPAPRAAGAEPRPGNAPHPGNAAPGWYRVRYRAPLFRDPNETSPVVTYLPAGTKVRVTRVLPGFLAVESVTGKPPGYLSSDDASPESEP